MAVARRDASENPLVEGLERLPVPPTTLIDLRRHRRPRPPQAAAGALQPRPRGRAAGALQPDRRRAARQDRRRLPRRARASRSRSSRAASPTTQVLDGLLERMQLRRLPVRRRRRATRRSREALDELDEEAGQPLNRVYYLSTAPEFFPVIAEQLKEAGPAPARDVDVRVHHREAVRHRPRVGARAAGGRLERLPRAAGLPHRPLPGQGDRPERDGVPVRELHVRAGLEPQLHRPHPDHRGRGHRHRHARRLLRPGGRAARPRAEPHAPAARRSSAWSRRRRSRPTRCATRRSRCCRRSRRRRPRRSPR